MITALDTSVLLDLFAADPVYGQGSRDAIARALGEGGLIACDVVFAEVAGAFEDGDGVSGAMAELGVRFVPIDQSAAMAAGAKWREYRRRGGKRERVIPDFLVGAHAEIAADRLLTRDRGFYRSYFANLTVMDPSG